MIEVTARFLIATDIERTWALLDNFERFAPCIPTLKSYQLLSTTRAQGRVGVKLGVLPVESRVLIEIREKRPPVCMKVEGISYLGETIVDQIRQGDAGGFDRDAVGRFHLHLDLREQEPAPLEPPAAAAAHLSTSPSLEGAATLLHFHAGVEAEGRMRKIYEAILKRKLPEMKQDFLQRLSTALRCEGREITQEASHEVEQRAEPACLSGRQLPEEARPAQHGGPQDPPDLS